MNISVRAWEREREQKEEMNISVRACVGEIEQKEEMNISVLACVGERESKCGDEYICACTLGRAREQ